MKIVSIVGTRPQFIKEAMLGHCVRALDAWQHVLIHSGQHYDTNVSDVFFEGLVIPTSDYSLHVGSGSHGEMTAAILLGVEKILLQECPDAVIVYGDTNTTVAGALAASKLCIPIIHIEAGIRMLPKTMPEEINRVVTDHLSSLYCCCSDLAVDTLAKEGIMSGVHVTGDLQLDLFTYMKSTFSFEKYCRSFCLTPGEYIVVTIHRDYNVDNKEVLTEILKGLKYCSQQTKYPIVFPIHPRTYKRIQEMGLHVLCEHMVLIPPQGYIELMSLVLSAAFVITDSGGLQKETYYAGKRAVVVMPDSGWRELIDTGWNVLTEPIAEVLLQKSLDVCSSHPYPEALYGTGIAAQHIINIIVQSI